MKKLSFLLLFLGMQWCALAKPELIISFNMNECANCYNALSNLKNLDSSFSLKYILPEEYEVDSIELKEYLSLPEQGEYIWSNALNNKYLINNVFSSITLVTENENMSFLVKEELDKDLVKYFNSLLEEEYIYDFKDNIFKVSNKYMKYYKNWVFISNNLTKNITKANFINGKSESIIEYTDEIINQAYQLANKDKDLIFGIGEQYGVKNLYTPENFDIYKDKVYLMTSYLDYHFENNFKDTLQLKFLSLQVFDLHGQLLNTYVVDYVLNDIMDGAMDYYTEVNSFKVESDSVFYFGLASGNDTINVEKEGYFIGTYHLNKRKNKIAFAQPWPFLLGEQYKYIGYNYANVNFSYDGRAVVNLLNDSIYVNNDGFKSYSMKVFEGNEPMKELRFYLNKKNREATITDKYIYLSYVIDGYLKYAKKEFNSEQVIIEDIFHFDEVSKMEYVIQIDYLNSDYLITPINHNQIRRYKIFK